MVSYITRPLQNIIPCFQRMLRQNSHLYSLKKGFPSRQFSSDFPNKYCDNKFGELRKRLAAVPCLKMLEKEEDRVRHYICFEKDERLKDVLKWFEKAFNYNATTGKKIRAAALLKAFCTYGFSMDDSSWDDWDSDKWRSAVLLAWCVELLQACYVVLDDMVDHSVLRRGKPCWYTKPDVGLQAAYDGFFLLSGVYKVLEQHFAGLKCYMNLYHEFLQTNHYTVCGETLDMIFSPKNQKPRFDMFDFENYQTLTEFKTSLYTFCLPVSLAMHLAGECSTEEFEYARDLCLKLSLFYAIQDDHFDFFGKEKVTGKIGNDIGEGKCTWLSVKFLEVASESMKKEFFENYGVDNKNAIAKVLKLYKETDLIQRFEETKAQMSAEIGLLIKSKNDIKGALFYELVTQIQKVYFLT